MINIDKAQRRLARLESSKFKKRAHKARLNRKIKQMIKAVNDGKARRAALYGNQVIKRVNGCPGEPDGNDFLLDCRHQVLVEAAIKAAINGLGN